MQFILTEEEYDALRQTENDLRSCISALDGIFVESDDGAVKLGAKIVLDKVRGHGNSLNRK